MWRELGAEGRYCLVELQRPLQPSERVKVPDAELPEMCPAAVVTRPSLPTVTARQAPLGGRRNRPRERQQGDQPRDRRPSGAFPILQLDAAADYQRLCATKSAAHRM